jgi:hypothetical protein
MTKRYRRSDVDSLITAQLRTVVDLAIRWEKLRGPMRYYFANDREHEITDTMWIEFHEVETALAEAVWRVTGRPSVPPEGWRSTFKVVK